MLKWRQHKAHLYLVELLASVSALNPRSLEMLSLTTLLIEPKSDVNNPVSSPTYMEQIQLDQNAQKKNKKLLIKKTITIIPCNGQKIRPATMNKRKTGSQIKRIQVCINRYDRK